MATDWDNWWKAYKKANPKAVINESTRDKFREWQKSRASRPTPPPPSVGAGSMWDATHGYNWEWKPGPAGSGTIIPTPPASPQGTPNQPQPAVDTPTPATPPTPPPPPPVNLEYEKAITAITNRLANLPTLYNTKRSDLYTDTRSQLLNQGYFDQLATTEGATKTEKDGNVSYKFSYGPDGRLYRQAYMTNTNNLAARGMASGSVLEAAQRQARDTIDSQRSAALSGYQKAVDQTIGEQGTESSALTDKLRDTRLDYGKWQSDQSVAPPTTTVDANAAAGSSASNTVAGGTTPTDTTSTTVASRNPNILGRGATRSAAVTQARKAQPGVKLEIRKRGGGKGFVAVRKPTR